MSDFLYDEPYNPLLETSEKPALIHRLESSHSISQDWQNSVSIVLLTKLLVAILVVNLAGYTAIVLLQISNAPVMAECGLRTDSLFGDSQYSSEKDVILARFDHIAVPWHEVVLENDQRFIDADSGDFDEDNTTNIWHDIYPGSWVAVSDPAQVGFDGGVKLAQYAEEPWIWDSKTEAFGVAVMHQIHCVAMLKHTILEYRRTGMTKSEDEHLDHCVEYLRQAVMCHGDLTLERPEKPNYPHRTTGWGNSHQCRDWAKLIKSVRALAIERGPTGWKRAK